MELEKKKARGQKQVYRGPLIKYHSTTMPLMEDEDLSLFTGAISGGGGGGGSGGESEINVDDDDHSHPAETQGSVSPLDGCV